MYYIFIAIIAFVLFILFLKALGAVVKSIVTTLFVVIVIVGAIIMYKSLSAPVVLFGMYRVDKFVVTRIK